MLEKTIVKIKDKEDPYKKYCGITKEDLEKIGSSRRIKMNKIEKLYYPY